MAAPDANSCFWGFYTYVKNNPYKPLGGMTADDFAAMKDLFIAANTDSLSTTATYTDCGAPLKAGTAGTVTMADTEAVTQSSWYPETHRCG